MRPPLVSVPTKTTFFADCEMSIKPPQPGLRPPPKLLTFTFPAPSTCIGINTYSNSPSPIISISRTRWKRVSNDGDQNADAEPYSRTSSLGETGGGGCQVAFMRFLASVAWRQWIED